MGLYIQSLHEHEHAGRQHHHHRQGTTSDQFSDHLSSHYHFVLSPLATLTDILAPVTNINNVTSTPSILVNLLEWVPALKNIFKQKNVYASERNSATTNEFEMDLDVLYEDSFLPKSILIDLENNIFRKLMKNIKVFEFHRSVVDLKYSNSLTQIFSNACFFIVWIPHGKFRRACVGLASIFH